MIRPNLALEFEMFRLSALVLSALFAFSVFSAPAKDAAAKQDKRAGITVTLTSPNGVALANGSTVTPVANYTLVNTSSSWVYVEVWSTDPGNSYYWGDAALAYQGGGTAYFGTSNAMPPGNYTCMVYSQTWAASDSVNFVVNP